MGRNEYGYKHRKEILFVVVLASLIVAVLAFAQTFDTPTVEDVSTLLEAGTEAGVTGEAAATGIVNESEAEIERIDSDGDGMSDWFEKNYTHTDPNVANDRYVLYLTTFGWEVSDIPRHFMEKNKVPQENIMIDNAITFSEFKEYIDWLTKTSDENDFVYLCLESHGSAGIGGREPYIIFADEQGNEHNGERVLYREIGEILNRVKCNKMLVAVHSCALNTSVEPLCEEANNIRICVAPTIAPAIGSSWPIKKESLAYEDWPTGICTEDWQCNGTYRLAKDIYDSEFRKGPYGKIGDEFLTVEIWIEGYKEIRVREWGSTVVKISDESNIASDFYFGEVKIKDYYPIV